MRWMRHPAKRKSTLGVVPPTQYLRRASPEVLSLAKPFANSSPDMLLSLEVGKVAIHNVYSLGLHLLFACFPFYLPLAIQLWPLLGKQHVVDRNIYLYHPEARQVLNPVYYVVAHSLRDLRNLPTVLDGQCEIYRRLFLSDLYRDST